MTARKQPDDRCAAERCNHYEEAHRNGLCSRCIGGRMKHPFKRKGAA